MRYLIARRTDDLPEPKFKNPYDGGMRVWHETFEIAKAEAERLCLKDNKTFSIFAEVGQISPAPKLIFQDYRKDT